jgi:hypothetical protein
MFAKRNLVAAALLAAGSTAFLPPAAQAAHVSVGIGIGYPGYVAPPPVVVAPPPVYYGAPTYYGGTAYYVPPPVVVGPGYWWYDQWGHRHWRRR